MSHFVGWRAVLCGRNTLFWDESIEALRMGITISIWGGIMLDIQLEITLLRLCSCAAIKLNFQPYIRWYTSSNENFEYRFPLMISTNCFVLILYIPVNNFLVKSGWVILGCPSTKQGIKCLAQEHNKVIPPAVRLKIATFLSSVYFSTDWAAVPQKWWKPDNVHIQS